MSNAIITDDLLEKVACLFRMQTAFNEESISYEIQDDSNHLLISVAIDLLPASESPITFRRIGALLNDLIPGRKGDYTWTVVFTKKGVVADSYFGGDLNSPDSGL